MTELTRFLILYTWAGVGLLILILYRIARFYQMSANERSHYRWFIAPLALLTLAALRYMWIADFAGDPLGDSLLMLGGGSLFLLSYNLFRLMTGGRS